MRAVDCDHIVDGPTPLTRTRSLPSEFAVNCPYLRAKLNGVPVNGLLRIEEQLKSKWVYSQLPESDRLRVISEFAKAPSAIGA